MGKDRGIDSFYGSIRAANVGQSGTDEPKSESTTELGTRSEFQEEKRDLPSILLILRYHN
jgi:hypothetical protein